MSMSNQPNLKRKSDWLQTSDQLSTMTPSVKAFNVRILQPRQSAPDYSLEATSKNLNTQSHSKMRLTYFVQNRQSTDGSEPATNLQIRNSHLNCRKPEGLNLYDRRISRLTDEPFGYNTNPRPSGLWKQRYSKNLPDQFFDKAMNDYKLNSILAVNPTEGHDENFFLHQNYRQSDQNSVNVFSKHLDRGHRGSIMTNKRTPNFDHAFNSQFNKNLANLTNTKFFRKTESKRFFQNSKNAQNSSKAMLTTITNVKRNSSVKLFSNVMHLAVIKFDQDKIDGGFDCSVVNEDLQNRAHFSPDTIAKLQNQLKLETPFKYYYDSDGNSVQLCRLCKTGCNCLSFLVDYIHYCIERQQTKLIFIVSKVYARNIFEHALTTSNGGNFKKKCMFLSQLFLKPPSAKPVKQDHSYAFPKKQVFPFRNYCSNPPSKRTTDSSANQFSATPQQETNGFAIAKTQMNFFDRNRDSQPADIGYKSQKAFHKENPLETCESSQVLRKTISSQFLKPKFSINAFQLQKTDARKIATNLLQAYFKSPHGTSDDLKELLELIRKNESSKQLNHTVKTMMKKDLNASIKNSEIRQNYFTSENALQENPQMSNLFKLNEHYVQMLSTYLSKEIGKNPLVDPVNNDTEAETIQENEMLTLLEKMIQEISDKDPNDAPNGQKKILLKRILNKHEIESQPNFIKSNIT
jgi:hypothetical protein